MADLDFKVSNVTNVTSNVSSNVTTSITKLETSQTYDPLSGLQTFVMYSISLGAILNNLMVFYTVPRMKKKINDSTRSAMLNLAVSDVLLGVGTFITSTAYLISPEAFFKHLCPADAYFNTLLGSVSILGLSFLNLDKFLTLAFPLRYAVHMTSKKAAAILIAIWISVLIYHTSFSNSFAAEERYVENTFICFGHDFEDPTVTSALQISDLFVFLLLPVTVSIVSLIGICCVMKRYKTRSENMHEGQQIPSPNIGKTSIYAILALNFTFFFMIMPFFFCNHIWHLATGYKPGPDASFVTVWLAAANSAVNPLIYIPTMRSYRKELVTGFQKLFKRRCGCGNEELYPGSNTKRTYVVKSDRSESRP